MLPDFIVQNWQLILTAVAPLIYGKYRSVDSATDRENKLKSSLIGRESESETTEKGNEFSIEIIDVQVYPAEPALYHYLFPLLPIIGGFRGVTDVELLLNGDIYVEEWALISEVQKSDLSDEIADMRLKGDRLRFTVNTVEEEELGEMLTGFRRMIERTDYYLAKESLSAADHKVLGVPVGGGYARPVLIDVSYPTTLTSRIGLRILKNNIRFILGNMSRAVVWERNTPYQKSSVIRLRIRKVDSLSKFYEVSTVDCLRFLLGKQSPGVRELFRILHMGYRTHRSFVEEDERTFVQKQGATCLLLKIAKVNELFDEETDLAQPNFGLDKLGIGIGNLNPVFNKLVPDPGREEVYIPIQNFDPRRFGNINLDPVEGGDRYDVEFLALYYEGNLDAVAISALGDGIVEVVYRSAEWYMTIRFGEDGNGRVWKLGPANPEEPVEKNGHVIWHKLHPGRETSFTPESSLSDDAGDQGEQV